MCVQCHGAGACVGQLQHSHIDRVLASWWSKWYAKVQTSIGVFLGQNTVMTSCARVDVLLCLTIVCRGDHCRTIVLSGRMRLVEVLCLCLATGALARSRQLSSSSHVFEKATYFSCDMEGRGPSLLALSLIHRVAAAALENARWFFTAATGQNNDEQRLDAAVGLPSSSFVLFLPLSELGKTSQ